MKMYNIYNSLTSRQEKHPKKKNEKKSTMERERDRARESVDILSSKKIQIIKIISQFTCIKLFQSIKNVFIDTTVS